MLLYEMHTLMHCVSPSKVSNNHDNSRNTIAGFEINVCPLARGKLNRLEQAIFRFNLPDGQANKRQRIKQHYLEMQFRSSFVAIK